MPLARSGVFGPGASCHNFQSSSPCFPSTSLHLPSSSLQPLADGPLAMADGQSSMVNGPVAGSMVHLPWSIFHLRDPHPHSLHNLHDFLDPVFGPFFWYPLFGAKVVNMCQNGSKKWPKSDAKSHFLPTWGTSFRYGSYQSGATLAHPGEVPKVIQKTSLQKKRPKSAKYRKLCQKVSIWGLVFGPELLQNPTWSSKAPTWDPQWCPSGPKDPQIVQKWLQSDPKWSKSDPKTTQNCLKLTPRTI